jgi:hypothetical protein
VFLRLLLFYWLGESAKIPWLLPEVGNGVSARGEIAPEPQPPKLAF